MRRIKWVLYAKRPFSGPDAVLAYLSRYTHRVAIANSRLISMDERGVTFKWRDYRNKGRYRYGTMTLTADEFIRRFLIHVLPDGFHHIRHYGLYANAKRRENLARARQLLLCKNPEALTDAVTNGDDDETDHMLYVCPECGAPMIIIETFVRQQLPRAPPMEIGGS